MHRLGQSEFVSPTLLSAESICTAERLVQTELNCSSRSVVSRQKRASTSYRNPCGSLLNVHVIAPMSLTITGRIPELRKPADGIYRPPFQARSPRKGSSTSKRDTSSSKRSSSAAVNQASKSAKANTIWPPPSDTNCLQIANTLPEPELLKPDSPIIAPSDDLNRPKLKFVSCEFLRQEKSLKFSNNC